MKGKNLAKLIGGLILAGIVVLLVFFWLNNRPDDGLYSEDGKVNTEAQEILTKDLDRNYPASVREVVRLFCRISKCWYNETISQGEFTELVAMQRMLFDQELLEENPLLTFTDNLEKEIATFREEKRVIINYRVQKESSVKKRETEEGKFASIVVCFMVKAGDYEYTYEEFLLREDENERWKIVGWRLTDPIEIED